MPNTLICVLCFTRKKCYYSHCPMQATGVEERKLVGVDLPGYGVSEKIYVLRSDHLKCTRSLEKTSKHKVNN
jgi:hypothetical protein